MKISEHKSVMKGKNVRGWLWIWMFTLVLLPSFCKSFHTIICDNKMNEWSSDELIQRWNGAELYVTWDMNNLYIGLKNVDVTTNSGNYYSLHIVIDKNPDYGGFVSAWEIVPYHFGIFAPDREFVMDPKKAGDEVWMQVNLWHRTQRKWCETTYHWIKVSDAPLNRKELELKLPWKTVSSYGFPGSPFGLVVYLNNRHTAVNPDKNPYDDTVDLVFPYQNPRGNNPVLGCMFRFASTRKGVSPNSCVVVGDVPESSKNFSSQGWGVQKNVEANVISSTSLSSNLSSNTITKKVILVYSEQDEPSRKLLDYLNSIKNKEGFSLELWNVKDRMSDIIKIGVYRVPTLVIVDKDGRIIKKKCFRTIQTEKIMRFLK